MPKLNTFRKLGKIAIAASLLASTPLSAAVLRETPTVQDTVVRLGDIFDDIANMEQAGAVIMEAPAPGQSKRVSVYELARLSEQFGLEWQAPVYIKRIDVTREGTSFQLMDLSDRIMEEAVAQGASSDVDIQLYGRKRGLFLPVDQSVADIDFEHFTLNNRKDRFTATALIPTGGSQTKRLNISGTLEEVRLIPMLNRVVSPGEIISQADISWEKFPVRRLTSRSVLNSADLIGQTVKRPMQPNKIIYENEITMPVVVEKDSPVTLTLRTGAMFLSITGRALEDGGKGDVIRVMNSKSKQTVDARVIRPGYAEVLNTHYALTASR